MNKLIEFNVSGGTVVVESQEAATGSVVRGAGTAQLTQKVGQSLEDALAVIRPVADAAMAVCGDLATVPDTVQVAFGVKFDVHIGAVIACAKTEASLLVTLVWKPVQGQA